jgi:mannose-P-dolichol utilization defect protein 1
VSIRTYGGCSSGTEGLTQPSAAYWWTHTSVVKRSNQARRTARASRLEDWKIRIRISNLTLRFPLEQAFSPVSSNPLLTMTIGTATKAPELLYGLFRPECYHSFFVQRHLLDIACLKLLLSKILSYGIILGAVFVKLPQIFKIVGSKSTTGLSPAMYVLENIGYLITVVYNIRLGYAFSTYGENVFLLMQGFILVALFGIYNHRLGTTALAAPFFGAAAYWLYLLAPLETLALCQTGTILIFASSRLPQIWNNFRSGSTGVLSFVTVCMNVAGTTARIFTTTQEVNDPVILAGTVSSWMLNLIIFLQVLWYWNSDKKAAAATKKEKKKQTGKAQ